MQTSHLCSFISQSQALQAKLQLRQYTDRKSDWRGLIQLQGTDKNYHTGNNKITMIIVRGVCASNISQ